MRCVACSRCLTPSPSPARQSSPLRLAPVLPTSSEGSRHLSSHGHVHSAPAVALLLQPVHSVDEDTPWASHLLAYERQHERTGLPEVYPVALSNLIISAHVAVRCSLPSWLSDDDDDDGRGRTDALQARAREEAGSYVAGGGSQHESR